MRRFLSVSLSMLFIATSLLASQAYAAGEHAELVRQVMQTETAFAKTMEARDHKAFAEFLADESIFFSGKKVLHGKQEVAAAWKRFYEGSAAPFSWTPETVEVLDSGKLALSSGPVRDPQGKLVATFTSIWRQESPGVWRIIFDKGNDVCDCVKP
ncbi:YybH family protein [Undibacterium pigrum]|uniref:Ketosteroid isomerase-like protein n=1 Tax=Undibacterium pigrum TaxID=401470 RepID=A0A318J916_9BURK|nr:nuclear transport factor 2 family protein [Undibacterium pigrum]PXX44812.1 ketosteroid isomerase-like protein [Undibacterium pigrum]